MITRKQHWQEARFLLGSAPFLSFSLRDLSDIGVSAVILLGECLPPRRRKRRGHAENSNLGHYVLLFLLRRVPRQSYFQFQSIVAICRTNCAAEDLNILSRDR